MIEMLVPFKVFPEPGPKQAMPTPKAENLRLALIDNGKRRAQDVLTRFGNALSSTSVISHSFIYTKTSGMPMQAEEVERIRAAADLVVLGVGDCGGCSSCASLDAIEFLNSGVYAVVIASKPFEYVVNMTARQRGVYSLPYLLIDHPIWTRDDEWIDSRASELASAFLASLPDRAKAHLPKIGAETEVRQLDSVFSTLRHTLQADDYDLSINHLAGQYVFRIEAGSSACADCLVPESMFVDIVIQVGQEAGLDIERNCVVVIYPDSRTTGQSQ
jgi:hypothetical protein